MPKLNKLALGRLALRYTIKDLSREEKLRVLADMFIPIREGVRWWGGNGYGPQALDQGIYNHVTKLRIVADLWAKLDSLGVNQVEEARIIRDELLGDLTEEDRAELFGTSVARQIESLADDDMPAPVLKAEPTRASMGAPEQMKLAVGSRNPSNFAAPDATDNHSFSL